MKTCFDDLLAIFMNDLDKLNVINLLQLRNKEIDFKHVIDFKSRKKKSRNGFPVFPFKNACIVLDS